MEYLKYLKYNKDVAFMGVCSIGLLCWLVLCANDQESVKKAFNKECLQYHKQFECTAMWRAGGSSHVTAFIPMYSGR